MPHFTCPHCGDDIHVRKTDEHDVFDPHVGIVCKGCGECSEEPAEHQYEMDLD